MMMRGSGLLKSASGVATRAGRGDWSSDRCGLNSSTSFDEMMRAVGAELTTSKL